MTILSESGEIIPNITLVDSMQFGVRNITSSFYYNDTDQCILMDVGTSENVQNLLHILKKNGISLMKVKGIILTHYHFDHGGGALKLWTRISKKNPNFKIYVPQDMHDKLQNAREHLIGAKTTFGDFVGTMDPIPESSYEIIKKNEKLPFDLQNGGDIELLATPGHSNDHCCPVYRQNGAVQFVFAGEAAGTLFHRSKLFSLPSSMPPNFNFEDYLQSLKKLQDLDVPLLGFCHFGAIRGKETVSSFLMEHINYITAFRKQIQKLYAENPSTKYIIDQTTKEFFSLNERVDPIFLKSNLSIEFFKKLQLALTYGMMVDLGFRKPKYEQKLGVIDG